MGDERVPNLSPIIQSLSAQSTQLPLNLQKGSPQSHQVHPSSPLRTGQNANTSTTRIVDRSGESPIPASSFVKFMPIPNEFPFDMSADTKPPRTLSGTVNRDFGLQPQENKVAQGYTARHMPGTVVSDTLTNTLANTLNLPSAGYKPATGTSTPPGRRSVQFARPELSTEQVGTPQQRPGISSYEDGDNIVTDRRAGSFFSKLRSLATSSGGQSHARSPSSFTVGGDSIDERFSTGPFSSGAESHNYEFSESPQEDSEIDADGEESTGEDAGGQRKIRRRRRKSRRPQDGGAQTAPTTPKTPFTRDGRPNIFSHTSSGTGDASYRPSFLPRRATTTDLPRDDRQGVSEDEGRERLARGSPWKRGSSWIHGPRGMSYAGKSTQQSTTDTPRPSQFRRALTGFGGSGTAIDGAIISPWKRGSERTSSISIAKWKQLKTAGIRLMGPRKKPENTIDHAKSAELLAELTAGVPAALILASMFQRDEHGNRRIPILLEQLKVRITDSKQVDSRSGDRHMIFKIELEYGNGLTRMKWVINRALRDFTNLHARYKLQISAQKYVQLKGHDARTRLPHFPRSTFPYLRGIRGLDISESEGEDEPDNDGTGPSGGDASGTDRPNKKKKRRPSVSLMRRKSSGITEAGNRDTSTAAVVAAGVISGSIGASGVAKRDNFAERQRRKLEIYLQQMIRYLIFRPESNRLCKFFELSALGVRLAAEGSYHGKEGLLIIQSGKGVDFRRAWKPTLILGRHSPKWFLVRHSYIVCVDSPEEMNIYDVFLVDCDFRIQSNKERPRIRDQKPKDLARTAKESASHPQHHRLKVYNSERKLRLLAKNERQLRQFEDSISFMYKSTPWSKTNRFDSFAPVRPKVFAQWLVDGRDYMWNVSRAISMAKDVIYIHDWWLSPELYMRRPAAISRKWRLDRLLQRKAQEGVKVFVIMYRNINSAIPIDSEYSKFSLLDLHPNVFVQRSPNQIRQGTFFWAHHEKICVVDHMIAFVGGIDLCFGRWDTPQHVVVDDKLTGYEESDLPKDADHCQLWPGKDYSNPRVQDFYALDKPYEEMYDRSKIARMPWHDIQMQVVGQPARDLTRHFVQRWNYILRQRRPTRPTPFLLPPPDFNPADLEALGLDGTCEVQILRSCCMWSMGTPDRVEHSILNAYVKMIEQSDHFVYVENQFFISSCDVEGTKIENGIGEALVERIIRASRNDEDWRAVLVIPLVPGFQNTVDSQDGTSVRLIMQCQFRSICRGDLSIFGRLRAEGIEPEDYIQFFSLRSWGKIGPAKELVTEQLYIHAKCMIVDDRIAIIGSANINERSMLGSRDSECAAVVRDTDMIWSTMNGKPYLVGRFPQTLRIRLMREHLGIDVDEAMEEEQQPDIKEPGAQWERDMDKFHNEGQNLQVPDAAREAENRLLDSKHKAQDELLAKSESVSFNHDVDWEQGNNPNIKTNKKVTEDTRVTGNVKHRQDVAGRGTDHINDLQTSKDVRGRTPTVKKEATQISSSSLSPAGNTSTERSSTLSPVRDTDDSQLKAPPLPPQLTQRTSRELGLPTLSLLPSLPKTDDTDIGGPSLQRIFSKKTAGLMNPVIAEINRPVVDKDCMRDPLNDSFYMDIWHVVAENNTKIFRNVFRCMPDNEVKTWKEYKEYAAYNERFSQSQGGGKSKLRAQQDAPGNSGPPGPPSTSEILRTLGPLGEKAGDIEKSSEAVKEKMGNHIPNSSHGENHTMGTVQQWAEEAKRTNAERHMNHSQQDSHDYGDVLSEKTIIRTSNDLPKEYHQPSDKTTLQDSEKLPKLSNIASAGYSDACTNSGSQRRRRRTTTRSSKREFHASDDMPSPAEAEELLKMVQGHLILWPYDWLAKEEEGGNWLYSIDQLAPLEIYN